MTMKLTQHVLVPVANEEDAATTASLLESYEFEQITVLHVIEKGEGVPDKTPVEQSTQIAEAAFETFREIFPDAETETAYRRDIVKGVFEVADEINASAIAFRPRGGSRLIQWLSGDRTLRLVTEADRPVITMPEASDT
ncbi:universal stress protein [Halorubrum ezzemoulense]|nr:universal stress protein [Halorubrum ezzemoulense]